MAITSFRIVFVSLISDYDREQFADNQIPLLVIGTKLDQIPETKKNEVLTRTAFLAEDFNAEEINLVRILVITFVFLFYGWGRILLSKDVVTQIWLLEIFSVVVPVIHILVGCGPCLMKQLSLFHYREM